MLRWLSLVVVVVVACKSREPVGKQPTPVEQKFAAPADAATVPDVWSEPRLEMVDKTIVQRGVTDERVITAMRITPRHEFVPPAIRHKAYDDSPLPIGFDKTISQAFIVATMTEAARVKPGDKVLEIGTGSGYQAAVLAMMGAKVYTMEIHEELAARTRLVLERLGYRNVQLKVADGFYGWADAAPFDAILVTCAAPDVPKPLFEQLKIGGRMVIPIGVTEQSLEVITRTATGQKREPLMDVRFGPMVGAINNE